MQRMLRDGLGDADAIRLIRSLYGLDLVAAKEVLVRAEGWAPSLDAYQESLVPAVERARDESEGYLANVRATLMPTRGDGVAAERLPVDGPRNAATTPLDRVFQHLDAWRHLPSYQLERRADVFFSVYLRDVVEQFTGLALEEEMIPELPIKRDLVRAEVSGEQSFKVDYALFARDRSRVVLVELKTDDGSRRQGQDDYLAAVVRLGFRPIVEGIRAILASTTSRGKYHHLALALARLGYMDLPSGLDDLIFSTSRRGLSAKLAAITVPPVDTPVDVVYIQPTRAEGERCIDFASFAAHVSRFDDPLSKRFAEHLLRWRLPAGGRPVGP